MAVVFQADHGRIDSFHHTAGSDRGIIFCISVAKHNVMDKKQKEKRETPIIDGDARPDMQVEPQRKKATIRGKTETKKFESERASDINSLEDYKDAK